MRNGDLPPGTKDRRAEAIFVICCVTVFVVIIGCVAYFVVDLLS
jgi:hypothetical protein